MKQLTIREAVPEDAETVFEITAEAFKKYAGEIESPASVEALRETKEDVLSDIENKTVLIAFLDGEPAGSVRFHACGPCAHLTRFGVRLMAQGYGVGRALVREVERRCRELGLQAVLLHTSAKVHSLMRFYYDHGFYVHSTTTDRGYIRALMVLELMEGNGLDYGELLG